MTGIGFIDSGNNPVIMASSLLSDFIRSGNLATHIGVVTKEIGAKKDLMVKELPRVGYARPAPPMLPPPLPRPEAGAPRGGAFVADTAVSVAGLCVCCVLGALCLVLCAATSRTTRRAVTSAGCRCQRARSGPAGPGKECASTRRYVQSKRENKRAALPSHTPQATRRFVAWRAIKRAKDRLLKGLVVQEKCEGFMRLCYAWLEPPQIIEGIKYLED